MSLDQQQVQEQRERLFAEYFPGKTVISTWIEDEDDTKARTAQALYFSINDDSMKVHSEKMVDSFFMDYTVHNMGTEEKPIIVMIQSGMPDSIYYAEGDEQAIMDTWNQKGYPLQFSLEESIQDEFQDGFDRESDDYLGSDSTSLEDYTKAVNGEFDEIITYTKDQVEKLCREAFQAGAMHCATEGKVYERSMDIEKWLTINLDLK